MNKTINIDNEDFWIIIYCAVRYALGRHNYVPELVTDFIRPLLPDIQARGLRVIERDVREFTEAEADRIANGVKCIPMRVYNLDEWENFLGDLQTEMERRGNNG